VHRPLGNALAVLVGELLEQLIILQQDRAARTGGDRVLVIRDRIAASGGERGFIGHGARPSGVARDVCSGSHRGAGEIEPKVRANN
jgi:hypothetical protein